MDADHFDEFVRWLRSTSSRRGLLQGLAASVFGFTVLRRQDGVSAKKRKNRRRKPERNAFGCVNVGKPCTGAGHCCSDICQGRRGKKTCRAHDADVCQAGQNNCSGTVVVCTTTTGKQGVCQTTTGNAPYCAADGDCFACATDADCRPFCGPAAACVRCPLCASIGLETGCSGPESCSFGLL